MSKYVDLAMSYHGKGYNCAQAVLCAFEEKWDVDRETLFRVSEALGFGMGAMGTCGAVSAMALAVGLSESDGNLTEPATKKISYKATKNLLKKFDEKNSSLVCRDIKGVDTGKILRSCDGCIEDAVSLLEEYFSAK